MRRDGLLIILLLALPLVIFDLALLVPTIGLPAAGATIVALALGWGSLSPPAAPVPLRIVAICVAIAVVACLLGGHGHVFYTPDDWIVRDAVLADLVQHPWPPRYRIDGQDFLLRAPLGLYLVPATVGKVAPKHHGQRQVQATEQGIEPAPAEVSGDQAGERAREQDAEHHAAHHVAHRASAAFRMRHGSCQRHQHLDGARGGTGDARGQQEHWGIRCDSAKHKHGGADGKRRHGH